MADSIWIKLSIGAIRIFSFVIDILTFPLYLIIQQPWRHRYSQDYVWAAQVSSFSSASHNEVTYRSNEKKYYHKIDLCKEMEENGVDTVEKMFNFVCSKHQNKPCIGTRHIISVNEEDSMGTEKTKKKYDMGDYYWISYEHVFNRALCFGKGVKELGYDSGTKVVIYADTRGKNLVKVVYKYWHIICI